MLEGSVEVHKDQENKTDSRPPCTVKMRNEPNLELMAKAFVDLYYSLERKGLLQKNDDDKISP